MRPARSGALTLEMKLILGTNIPDTFDWSSATE